MGEHIHHHRKDLKNKKLELTMSKTLNLRVMHTAESEFSNCMKISAKSKTNLKILFLSEAWMELDLETIKEKKIS